MDVCTRKTNRKEIWRWMHQAGIYWLTDVLDTEGNIRVGMLETTDPTTRSSIIQQLTEHTRKHPQTQTGKHNQLFPGCVVKNLNTHKL